MSDRRHEDLIFAVTGVLSSTQACADHGDEKMFDVLRQYYAIADAEAKSAQGRVIKVMGDAILLIFPIDDPHAAISALRTIQVKANQVWQLFDPRCSVQLKVGAGKVIVGILGVPGEERPDIVGTALNKLMKAPWGTFEIMPELASRLR